MKLYYVIVVTRNGIEKYVSTKGRNRLQNHDGDVKYFNRKDARKAAGLYMQLYDLEAVGIAEHPVI